MTERVEPLVAPGAAKRRLALLSRGLTLPQLWLYLAVALPVVASLLVSLSTVDLAYQLRLGDGILAGGGIPNVDTFTFTAAGTPWQDQQWGAQVLLAAVYGIGGWGGLAILRAVLVGVAFGAVLVTARRAGARERDAALLTVGAFLVAATALALRPQLFAIVLFALMLLVLRERHAHRRLLWTVPLLTVTWANLHGSFFLAPAAVGFAWLEDVERHDPAARRTLLVALVSAAATLVNPFGPWIYGYVLGIGTNPAITSSVSEWQPTTLSSPGGLAFYLSGLAVAAILARGGRAASWSTLGWMAALFLLGVYALRGAAWWPIGAATAMAAVIAVMRPAPARSVGIWHARPAPMDDHAVRDRGVLIERRSRRINLAIAAVIALAGVALLPFWRPSDPLTGPAAVVGDAPPGITRAILATAAPGDRIFDPQPWGSWLEFATPDQPVFIDSRIELFTTAVFDDYGAVVDGRQGWQEVLGRWGVTFVVVSMDQPDAFHARMQAEPGWREIHADADGWVFERVDRPTATGDDGPLARSVRCGCGL